MSSEYTGGAALIKVRANSWLILGMLVMLCMLFPGFSASADPAAEITQSCEFSIFSGKKTFGQCIDRDYKTYWKTNNSREAYLEVTLPEDCQAGGVMTKWFEHPHAWGVQVQNDQGDWVDAGHTEGSFLTEFLPLPEGTSVFRIANAPGEYRHFNLMELYIYTAGELPEEVQQWNPPAEKADLMLLAAHPDDEILWFGGTLPRYAGEEKKICQVCTLVPSIACRRIELLDCLWTCGVRNYPVWGNCRDSYSSSLAKQYTIWDRYHIYDIITGWIRRFRPDVLLTHDPGGEYGHGAHRVCADAAVHCIELAGKDTKYPKSAAEYGLWDVPKCYLHLYAEQQIHMDWRQPLEAFDGSTGFDIAVKAFQCHISQQKTDYHVEDWGKYDCSLFGLYRTLVGPDEKMNDFFEHIP